jgi:hypothetical protein
MYSAGERAFHSILIAQAIVQDIEARQTGPEGHLIGDASISAHCAVDHSLHRYRNGQESGWNLGSVAKLRTSAFG